MQNASPPARRCRPGHRRVAAARAAQITQALPAVEDLGDFTPFDITGSRFDPALGALTAVTGELTGTVTANTLIPLPPFPTTRQTTTYFVFTPSGTDPGPNVFRGALADQIVTPVLETGGGTTEGRYTGAPTAVDLTFDFGDVSEFIGAPSPPTTLVEFGFRAGLPDRPEITGGASDETTFNGSLRLTYTYVKRLALIRGRARTQGPDLAHARCDYREHPAHAA